MSIYEVKLQPTLIKKTITIDPSSSLFEARNLLSKFRITRLVVTDKKNMPVGIITEKDIAKSIYKLDSKHFSSLRVKDVMSKDLVVAGIYHLISDCAKLMLRNEISSIIVVNPDKTLAGIITKSDILHTFLVYETSKTRISSIMSTLVISVSPDDSLYEVESMLFNNKISRLVVEHNKKPVGIISYRDLIPTSLSHPSHILTDKEERKDVQWEPWLNQLNAKSLTHSLTFTAKDVMTKNPLVISANEFVSLAVLMMLRHDISGIPVTKNEKLVGIITKTDVVKLVAEKP